MERGYAASYDRRSQLNLGVRRTQTSETIRVTITPDRPRMARYSIVPAVVLFALACGSGSKATETALTQPPELLGRWVRLRADSTWGDTLEYLASGQVRGSQGHSVPPTARWGVKAGPAGTRQFCAGDEKDAYCQTFRFEDSVMVLGGGPSGPSYFRRVP
jgi:hypothetical protein